MASNPSRLVLDFSEIFNALDQSVYLQDSDTVDNEFWSRDRISRQVSRSDVHRLWLGSDFSTSTLVEKAHDQAVSDDSEALNADEAANVFDFPQVFISRRLGEKSVNTLAEWECVIDRRDEENRMIEVTYEQIVGGADSRGKMAIPFEEFSDRDLDRVSRGHIFRLIVGYSKQQDGSRRRQSIVYVRPHVREKAVKFGSLLDLLVDEDS